MVIYRDLANAVILLQRRRKDLPEGIVLEADYGTAKIALLAAWILGLHTQMGGWQPNEEVVTKAVHLCVAAFWQSPDGTVDSAVALKVRQLLVATCQKFIGDLDALEKAAAHLAASINRTFGHLAAVSDRMP